MKIHLIKITKILIITIYIICFLTNCVVAVYQVSSEFSGDDSQISDAVNSTQEILLTVLGAVRTVGMAVAVIMLTYVGIKFMMAAPSERANIKQYLINYVIGACILFAASGILTLVKTVAQNAIKAS